MLGPGPNNFTSVNKKWFLTYFCPQNLHLLPTCFNCLIHKMLPHRAIIMSRRNNILPRKKGSKDPVNILKTVICYTIYIRKARLFALNDLSSLNYEIVQLSQFKWGWYKISFWAITPHLLEKMFLLIIHFGFALYFNKSYTVRGNPHSFILRKLRQNSGRGKV